MNKEIIERTARLLGYKIHRVQVEGVCIYHYSIFGGGPSGVHLDEGEFLLYLYMDMEGRFGVKFTS